MNDSTMIKSQLKSLEAQLRVMEALVALDAGVQVMHAALEALLRVMEKLVGRLPDEQASERHSFGDLFGSLSDQAESSEEEIDAILYKMPAAKENEI